MQLTCFAGRLDQAVTEEDLHQFLSSQGMRGVVCKKLIAKNGQVFKTSAFRVTCSAESASLFYDEGLWPAGVELRDWIFYRRDDRQ